MNVNKHLKTQVNMKKFLVIALAVLISLSCLLPAFATATQADAAVEAANPDICLWPTPTWVWDNRNGNLQTLEVRAWIEEIGVKKNYLAWEGSQVICL